MPQTHPTASATGLLPIPVAVLLPTPTSGPRGGSAVRDLPDWHGVTARDTAGLITRLSAEGELVIELDGHPTILRAAEYHGRRSGSALPGRTEAVRHRRPAGLIFAALPRPGIAPGGLGSLSTAMQTWRAGLRPGGYLLTVLTRPGSGEDATEHPLIYRAGVIAAARTAGLTWQQEFLVLNAPPPTDEPRAMPGTPVDLPSALVNGRHLCVHVKVLAFRNNAHGGSDV
jgi:hypothetical protein